MGHLAKKVHEALKQMYDVSEQTVRHNVQFDLEFLRLFTEKRRWGEPVTFEIPKKRCQAATVDLGMSDDKTNDVLDLESLSHSLRTVTYKHSDLKLWKSLKDKMTSTAENLESPRKPLPSRDDAPWNK